VLRTGRRRAGRPAQEVPTTASEAPPFRGSGPDPGPLNFATATATASELRTPSGSWPPERGQDS